MRLRSTGIAIGLLAALAVFVAAANADDDRSDQELARQAVQRGEIMSLTEILQAVRGKLPGEITGVKIDSKDGRLIYEFRVVAAKGRLFKVYVDAATGTINRTKEK